MIVGRSLSDDEVRVFLGRVAGGYDTCSVCGGGSFTVVGSEVVVGGMGCVAVVCGSCGLVGWHVVPKFGRDIEVG